MGAFVISKRFNGEFKFVFTSRKGKTIFTSNAYASKEACEHEIALLKLQLDKAVFQKFKATGGKHYFKLELNYATIATSRKYTTELRLQKGIDEIVKYGHLAETLDFSGSDFAFPPEEAVFL
ncbi:DUF1508 domain-containing protein [Flavobacterium branchiophilum]|uniref:DUF1508 domain-containing protein n=1 Tax=Flavobacterium branchiophilum (strain FL-15) TaxID=1034807 RepID=G2Z564_FLABF|nr:DUF1508 domain-containing protein [Flavobacterium branchiophilum]CCB68570.1 Protein of unknown function [Flavobacterium branchiophilum FL-15]